MRIYRKCIVRNSLVYFFPSSQIPTNEIEEMFSLANKSLLCIEKNRTKQNKTQFKWFWRNWWFLATVLQWVTNWTPLTLSAKNANLSATGLSENTISSKSVCVLQRKCFMLDIDNKKGLLTNSLEKDRAANMSMCELWGLPPITICFWCGFEEFLFGKVLCTASIGTKVYITVTTVLLGWIILQ